MTQPHQPRVEMLWEASDPSEALESRFGFGHAGAASHWVAAMAGEHWGIRVDACERIVISDRNALAWVGTSSGRMCARDGARHAPR